MGFEFEICKGTLSEIDGEGFHGVQLEWLGRDGSGPPIELHHPYGFASRMLDPDVDPQGAPTMACNVLRAWDGSQGHAWLLGDPRITTNLPPLKKGETCQYGPKGQFVRCYEDGSVATFTTDDATFTGKTVASWVRPHEFKRVAPWGTETFDATGYHLVTKSGARVDAGGIFGMPAPLDVLGCYYNIQADILSFNAATVSLGNSKFPSMPVVLAPPMAAWVLLDIAALQAIAASLAAVQLALTKLALFPTNAVVAGDAIAASAAVVTAAAIIVGAASAPPLIGASSVNAS